MSPKSAKGLPKSMHPECSEDDPPPPWGYLPVEQYLLHHWDQRSPLSNEEQRRALVRAFLEEDILDSTFFTALTEGGQRSRVPTDDEIRRILEPLRPQSLRKTAQVHANHSHIRWEDPVYVRTYYAGGVGDDERMKTWLREAWASLSHAEEMPKNQWWQVLNDDVIFNFDSDWRKVLDVMPEIVGYRENRALNLSKDGIVERLSTSLSREPWLQQLAHIVQDMAHSACSNTLIIFDKVFFDTIDLTQEQVDAMEEIDGEMGALIIFLDAKGNQVRASRIWAYDVCCLDISYFRCNTDEQVFWVAGQVGEKYKPDGEVVRQFHDVEGVEPMRRPSKRARHLSPANDSKTG